MSGPEAKNPPPAGISAPDDLDVADLFEQLREELGRGAGGGGTESEFAATRALAERFWPVTAEREVGGGPKGLVKRFLRKLMRWYVEPLAADQRVYNSSLLKLVDALSERADAAAASNARAQQLLRELEERLTRVERRGSAGSAVAAVPPVTVAAQPAAAALPDYFAFESRMRGSVDTIRERQRRYVDDLRGAAPVLDIGCGRGELLQLLREAGLEARGIDADADMVAYARGEGLDVEQADLVEYLERQDDGSLGGIFMGQVVEHLPPAVLVRALELAAAKLRGGGLLVAETINPLSPLALRHYFADLTHAQPLVPETLELLARQSGFAETEIRYLNEPAERLAEPDDPVIAANVRRLNELLFAPLDYALVARTAADA
ncbi:MAG TPA: class I SAM-dependent methyltransferase [Gaiellaceae bacterium]|nr:class I SAM-dependent methyltransferase [Gaiellaceae bacterium]